MPLHSNKQLFLPLHLQFRLCFALVPPYQLPCWSSVYWAWLYQLLPKLIKMFCLLSSEHFQRHSVDQQVAWALEMLPTSEYLVKSRASFWELMKFLYMLSPSYLMGKWLYWWCCGRYVRDLLGPITRNLATLSKREDLQTFSQQPDVILQVIIPDRFPLRFLNVPRSLWHFSITRKVLKPGQMESYKRHLCAFNNC
jgi:hypothetical protein